LKDGRREMQHDGRRMFCHAPLMTAAVNSYVQPADLNAAGGRQVSWLADWRRIKRTRRSLASRRR
jgi:hypothetical protein